MNDCAKYGVALVDEALERPAGLEQHLAGCADCQGLQRSHSMALKLSGLTPVASKTELSMRGKRALAALLFLGGSGLVTALAVLVVAVTVRINDGGTLWERMWGLEPDHDASPARVVPHEGDDPELVDVADPDLDLDDIGNVDPDDFMMGELEDDPEWEALIALRDEVAAESRRDVVEADETYRAYGALAAWVAPRHPIPRRGLEPAEPPEDE